MRDVELLGVMAQIAVGLAGFTGVASVLGPRAGEAEARAQAERLRGMITLALIVGGAALLPIVLTRAGMEEQPAWRLSAALFLATFLPTAISGIRRAARVNRALDAGQTSLRLWGILAIGVAAFACVALACGIVGLAAASSVYPLALYALLVWSALLFLRFFLAASRSG